LRSGNSAAGYLLAKRPYYRLVTFMAYTLP
jgi:hypothetical protein